MRDALFSANETTAKKAAVVAALYYGFTVRNYGAGWKIDVEAPGPALPVDGGIISDLCRSETVRYVEFPEYLEVVL